MLSPFSLPDPGAPGQGISDLHVLLVEDDELQLALLSASLRHCGVTHLTALNDGWGALAHLAAARCDLVISDLRMPGMDGIEFLHRATEFDVGAFVIFSAAEQDIMHAAEALVRDCGGQLLGLLPKPPSLQQVRSLLEKARRITHALRRGTPESDEPIPEAELAGALERNEFVPYYQPKMNLQSGTISGVEVLCRWQRGCGELIGPGQFIHLMEGTPLMAQLSWALLDRALADTASWTQDASAISVAFNLSAGMLEDPALPDKLLNACRRHGLPPQRITLELTETVAASRPRLARDTVARLGLRGFKMSIDDFGTGYSSMDLLLRLPFRELKIDRSFIASLKFGGKATPMLEAMITLGRRLNMEVVAEGVETDEELDCLRQLGCTTVQGYLFAKPMTNAALRSWLMTYPGAAAGQPAPELILPQE